MRAWSNWHQWILQTHHYFAPPFKLHLQRMCGDHPCRRCQRSRRRCSYRWCTAPTILVHALRVQGTILFLTPSAIEIGLRWAMPFTLACISSQKPCSIAFGLEMGFGISVGVSLWEPLLTGYPAALPTSLRTPIFQSLDRCMKPWPFSRPFSWSSL